MPLTSVMYELSTDCPKCRNPVPLNGATESVLCASCQAPLATPPELWQTVLGEATGEALAMEEGNGRNTTMMLGKLGLTVKGTYGRLGARCEPDCKEPYPPDDLAAKLKAGGGELFCGACGKKSTVRPAPDWFAREVHPAAVGLVSESHAADRATAADPKDVRFHCYHCGGAAPLDPANRTVKCAYCSNELMVPDEIWVRLHPVEKVRRWFALLDVGGGVRAFPEDVWEFCDFTVDPGGNLVVAWHDDDEGDAGHRCRVGVVNPAGMLTWVQDGVLFSDETELMVSPHDARIVLIDQEEGFVRLLDSATGQPVRTLSAPDEDGPDATICVRGHEGVAVDWHGDLVVRRSWEDTGETALRRFGPDGARKPLWPGMAAAPRERSYVDWEDIGDRPNVVPRSALFGFGWDGCFYLVADDARQIAKLAPDGRFLGRLDTGIDFAERVHAFGVSRDGTMHVLFRHATPVRDEQWSHVARIHPTGQVELWLGPHAPDSPLIGQYDDKLEVMPDGTTYLGHEVESLRIIGPDRQVRFMTNASRRHEREYLREHLEKLRRGRKVAGDRGD